MDGKTAEVLVGIVTFNPDNKRLSVNLNAAALQAENIVIVDNGSHNIRETEELISHFDNNIVLIKWKENRQNICIMKIAPFKTKLSPLNSHIHHDTISLQSRRCTGGQIWVYLIATWSKGEAICR